MQELNFDQVELVNGGSGSWEDIGCTSDGTTTTCSATLGQVADGISDAVGALNDLGSALGGWLYDTLN